jgi:hypothetical protein
MQISSCFAVQSSPAATGAAANATGTDNGTGAGSSSTGFQLAALDFTFGIPIPPVKDLKKKLQLELIDLHRMRWDSGLKIQKYQAECPETIRNGMPEIRYNQRSWVESYPELLEADDALQTHMAQLQDQYLLDIQEVLVHHTELVIKGMEKKIIDIMLQFPVEDRSRVNDEAEKEGKKRSLENHAKRAAKLANQSHYEEGPGEEETVDDDVDVSAGSSNGSLYANPGSVQNGQNKKRQFPFKFRGNGGEKRGGYRGGPRGGGGGYNGRGRGGQNGNRGNGAHANQTSRRN